MTDPIVYRSRDPQVLAAWREAGEAIDAYVAATQVVAVEAAGVAGVPA